MNTLTIILIIANLILLYTGFMLLSIINEQKRDIKEWESRYDELLNELIDDTWEDEE